MSELLQPDQSIGEDLDLENAIGDVFDQFDFNPTDNNNDQNKEQEEQLPIEQHQEEEEVPNKEEEPQEDIELDLDDVIGDAFNDVFGGTNSKQQQQQQEEELQEDKANEVDHLEDAIGEAFSGVFGETTHDKETVQETRSTTLLERAEQEEEEKEKEKEKSHQDDETDNANEQKSDSHYDEPDDEDLEDLIGQAFDNVTSLPEKSPKEPESTQPDKEELPARESTNEEQPNDLPREKPAEEQTIEEHSTDEKATECPEPKETNLLEELKSNEQESEPKPVEKELPEKEEPELKDNTAHEAESNEDLEDLDLAIGQAFQNAISGGQENTGPVKEPQLVKSNENEDEQDEQEVDLDEAIGDAFKDLMSSDKAKEATDDVPAPTKDQDKTEIPAAVPTEDKSDDDMDLDEAIGDVFNNILGNKEKETPKPIENVPSTTLKEAVSVVSKPSVEDSSTDAIDLDAAIGDAFNDILGGGEKDDTSIPSSTVNDAKRQESKEKATIDIDSMDLDKAIGAAFEHLIDKDAHSTPIQKEISAKDSIDEDIDLDAAIGNAFKNVLPQLGKDKSLPLPPDETDNALENAIGEAFKSLSTSAKKDDQPNDDDLNALIAQSFQQALKAPKGKKKQQPRNEDMESAITQAFKSVMAAKKAPQLTSREIAIRNLAVEISHQVQDHLKDDKFNPPLPFIPGLPQLDAGVLEHFQKEAYTDDNKDANENGRLQSAISNAMKTADIQAGGIADLEQLEMNDILQNAFKMALEHPQELLSNLELEPSIQVPPLTSTRPIPPRRPKFASPKPTAGPSFKSYPRSAPVVTTPRPQPPKPTATIPRPPATRPSVVTAEAQRKPSLLSNPAVTSQLTTVISSLTSRINSGELSDANILQVIRQMTEELASGGSLTPFLKKSTAIEDVVASYRDNARQDMLKALQLTKIFIETKLGDDSNKVENKKSVDLLTTIITAFDPIGYAKSVVKEIKDDEVGAIFVYFNEVMNVFLKNCHSSRFSPAIVKNIKEIQEKLPTKNITNVQSEVDKMSKDEKLTKPLTDLFNLLAGSSLLDNSQAMLISSVAALSVTGFVYKETTKSNNDSVINAVSKIVKDIITNTPGMAITDGTTASASTTKRISDLILAGDRRRTKIDPEQIKIAVNGSNKENQEEQNNSWNSQSIATAAASIRIPQYRRPSAIDKNHIPHKPALTLPKNSPFISNKFSSNLQQPLQISNSTNSNGGGVGIATGGGGGGIGNRLKRPGSFQRPANAKSKTTSLGFPKLYSTSIKYN